MSGRMPTLLRPRLRGCDMEIVLISISVPLVLLCAERFCFSFFRCAVCHSSKSPRHHRICPDCWTKHHGEHRFFRFYSWDYAKVHYGLSWDWWRGHVKLVDHRESEWDG